jgi:hypothetical protein
MSELNEFSNSNIDTKKEAVDELIKYCRSSEETISPDEIFKLYAKILDEKKAANAAFDPKI